ncbi:MAG: type VII toxin-antitoxin system MntA family adenylyltransferase antitoxin [Bacteroidales bacterium]
MNVEELLEVLRARVPGVAAVYLFGSSEHDTEHAESDIDLAVLAASKLAPAFRWELQEELALLAHRAVDLVDLGSASTVMRMQVVSTGRLLFSTDRAVVDRFEMLVLADYSRLNEERAAILDDARRRGRIHA